MQFIIDNQDTYTTLGTILLAILIFVLVSYAKKNNIFTKESVENAEHTIILVENLMRLFKLDDKLTSESKIIIDACKQALEYAENVMNVTDDENKKKIVYDAVVQSLNKLNIEVDDSRKNLINVGIEFALLKL